ncbi:MAG: hypothetical protein K6G26_04295, partial [Lachnospiraceae bacterium]|nr:hypothetical protein [Lachnospiraceae bacterium]
MLFLAVIECMLVNFVVDDKIFEKSMRIFFTFVLLLYEVQTIFLLSMGRGWDYLSDKSLHYSTKHFLLSRFMDKSSIAIGLLLMIIMICIIDKIKGTEFRKEIGVKTYVFIYAV